MIWTSWKNTMKRNSNWKPGAGKLKKPGALPSLTWEAAWNATSHFPNFASRCIASFALIAKLPRNVRVGLLPEGTDHGNRNRRS